MDEEKRDGAFMEKIDIVVLWVDGSDVEWLEEKKQYDKSIVDVSSCAARFRDWNNMQYWFRGVEKFAPWFNNIFFITWGHVPAWLNTNHPKIRIVKHTDFIPAEYLPTYNSNAIELNIHRIPELSEHFVLFNDDMFVIKETKAEDYFVDGKPRDEFVLNPIVPHHQMPIIGHTCVNNLLIIDQYFKKSEVLKKSFFKIFNFQYGSALIRTLLLLPWDSFAGIHNTHLPQAHLKSTFETLWELEPEKLHNTCLNKFRRYNDVSHWLMRYWNLCKGNFVPRRSSFGKLFNASDNNEEAVSYIIKQKGLAVCINDTSIDFNFKKAEEEINEAFEAILSEKSSFEK